MLTIRSEIEPPAIIALSVFLREGRLSLEPMGPGPCPQELDDISNVRIFGQPGSPLQILYSLIQFDTKNSSSGLPGRFI